MAEIILKKLTENEIKSIIGNMNSNLVEGDTFLLDLDKSEVETTLDLLHTILLKQLGKQFILEVKIKCWGILKHVYFRTNDLYMSKVLNIREDVEEFETITYSQNKEKMDFFTLKNSFKVNGFYPLTFFTSEACRFEIIKKNLFRPKISEKRVDIDNPFWGKPHKEYEVIFKNWGVMCEFYCGNKDNKVQIPENITYEYFVYYCIFFEGRVPYKNLKNLGIIYTIFKFQEIAFSLDFSERVIKIRDIFSYDELSSKNLSEEDKIKRYQENVIHAIASKLKEEIPSTQIVDNETYFSFIGKLWNWLEESENAPVTAAARINTFRKPG